MRKLLSLFVLLLFTSQVFGQIKIAEKDRVENEDPGYCAWATISTLGRYHKVKALYDLVESRKKDKDVYVQDDNGRWVLYKKNAGYDFTIREKLDKLGINYKMSATGSYDTELLEYAIKNNLGCACAVKGGALGGSTGDSGHAVTVISYNDKEVQYIDPNDKAVYTATRKWWDYWWDGWVLVVIPLNDTMIVNQKPIVREEVQVSIAQVEKTQVQWKYLREKK